MKISIALASYNGEKFIKDQLDSFLSQTRLPDELIITDDCSSDRTGEIVSQFADKAPFDVVFFRNEKNLGYCGNFNAALMKTTGDLVFLSDQDDVWFPEKIETVVRLAEQSPDALVIMNDAELTDGDLNSVGLTKIGQIRSAGIGLDAFVMGCCCAVRRELLDICMPIGKGFKSHDRWLVNFADSLGGKLVDTTVLQYYRRHELNESQFMANRTTKIGRWDFFIQTVERLLSKERRNNQRNYLVQLKIFVSGIERALERDKSRFGQKLENLLVKKQREISEMEDRNLIRDKPFVPRFWASLRYWLRGGYAESSGVKSLIRDILG